MILVKVLNCRVEWEYELNRLKRTSKAVNVVISMAVILYLSEKINFCRNFDFKVKIS